MLRSLAAHRLTRSSSPTVDLYFADSCADLISADGPIRQISPTVFESTEARLVVRHDVGAPPVDRTRRLIYLLDDAIFDGLADRSLPISYRAKLWAADCATARRILPHTDVLVVSRKELIECLPDNTLKRGAHIFQIDPFWREQFSTLSHFDVGPAFDVAFLGAGTHRGALEFLAETIHRASSLEKRIRFWLSANHKGRFRAARLPIDFVGTTAWPAYRRALVAHPRHLALYPLPDTPYAGARSANKLIEHAVIGAGAIYSQTWSCGAAAAATGAGLALPHDPASWAEATACLAADGRRARALAEGVQRYAAMLNRPDAQRRLWSELMIAA